MSLRDELATILREHVSDADGACEVCDILLADDEWENHVVGLQIAYLRDNLAEHGDELGLTREFAVCVEDDGDVFLYGYRYLNRAIAQRESDEMTERFETFVGTAWTTDWSRDDD